MLIGLIEWTYGEPMAASIGRGVGGVVATGGGL